MMRIAVAAMLLIASGCSPAAPPAEPPAKPVDVVEAARRILAPERPQPAPPVAQRPQPKATPKAATVPTPKANPGKKVAKPKAKPRNAVRRSRVRAQPAPRRVRAVPTPQRQRAPQAAESSAGRSWPCWLVRMHAAGKTEAQLEAMGRERGIRPTPRQIRDAKACLAGR